MTAAVLTGGIEVNMATSKVVANFTPQVTNAIIVSTNTIQANDGPSGGANLSYIASPSDGVIANDGGTDATISLADATNAGLLAPSEFSIIGRITVTEATDLDAIRQASHEAATAQGSSSTNPVTIFGQAIGFSIANLASAP